MTDKKPHRLDPYKFKPGQSGNPAGRPIPEWLKGIKLLPKHVASILWSKYLSMDANELERIASNVSQAPISALELAICRAIQADIERGEIKNTEIGLSRIIGRLGDAPPDPAKAGLEELTQEELMNRVKIALTVLEDKAK